MGFLLTKWYLDGVTTAGEVRVGYAAQLEAGVVRQRYASLLSASTTRAPRVQTRLREARLPEQHGEVIEWAVAGLAVSGRWTSAGDAPLAVELLEEPGALSWHCLQPRAHVELTHEGVRLRGIGYAERVALRVPPWQLPVDELRWGRAHVGPHTLVWIDWRGPRTITRIFLDGEVVDGAVTDDVIVTPALRVQLAHRRTLREGDIAKTALARVPAVRGLLSRNKLMLEETKWLSQAVAGVHTGFAIHEVVRWR